MSLEFIARWKISLSDVFPAFAIYIYLRFWKFSWLHCPGGCVNSTFPSLTIMMMAVGGVFGGFNVRAEPRIWGAPHHQAGRERAGGGARLSRGKAGENFWTLIFLIFATNRHGECHRPCTFFKDCGFSEKRHPHPIPDFRFKNDAQGNS